MRDRPVWVCSGLSWLPKPIVLHRSPVFLRHNYCFSVHLLKTSVSPLKQSPTHLEQDHVGALCVLLHHLSLIAGTLLHIYILYIPSNPLYGLKQHIWLSVYTSGCCLEAIKLRKTHYCSRFVGVTSEFKHCALIGHRVRPVMTPKRRMLNYKVCQTA